MIIRADRRGLRQPAIRPSSAPRSSFPGNSPRRRNYGLQSHNSSRRCRSQRTKVMTRWPGRTWSGPGGWRPEAANTMVGMRFECPCPVTRQADSDERTAGSTAHAVGCSRKRPMLIYRNAIRFASRGDQSLPASACGPRGGRRGESRTGSVPGDGRGRYIAAGFAAGCAVSRLLPGGRRSARAAGGYPPAALHLSSRHAVPLLWRLVAIALSRCR